jgi:hypothetical protein
MVERRRHWQIEARELILRDKRNAYYNADRLPAQARAAGDAQSFVHWTNVAAEVAKLPAIAEVA